MFREIDKSVVSCVNLKKSYDLQFNDMVLKGVDLSVEPGTSVAITGSSGSGKTTLLNLIAGLESPDAGEVYVANHNLAKLTQTGLCKHRNLNIGVVFQFHGLLLDFTALENIAMPMLIAGNTRKESFEKANTLLSKVGLGDKGNRLPANLSGGECQRVAVARAVVMTPVCVLADEPTGNLDKKNADIVCNLLVSLCDEFDSALIVTTHDLSVADYMNNKMGLIDGKLAAM